MLESNLLVLLVLDSLRLDHLLDVLVGMLLHHPQEAPSHAWVLDLGRFKCENVGPTFLEFRRKSEGFSIKFLLKIFLISKNLNQSNFDDRTVDFPKTR